MSGHSTHRKRIEDHHLRHHPATAQAHLDLFPAVLQNRVSGRFGASSSRRRNRDHRDRYLRHRLSIAHHLCIFQRIASVGQKHRHSLSCINHTPTTHRNHHIRRKSPGSLRCITNGIKSRFTGCTPNLMRNLRTNQSIRHHRSTLRPAAGHHPTAIPMLPDHIPNTPDSLTAKQHPTGLHQIKWSRHRLKHQGNPRSHTSVPRGEPPSLEPPYPAKSRSGRFPYGQ